MTELRDGAENPENTCNCQPFVERKYNESSCYDTYNSTNNYENDFSCCCANCKKTENNYYCTKCKKCPVKAPGNVAMNPNPPDIIKLCPPRKQECCCKCESNYNNELVNYTNSDKKCPQGFLQKSKSYPTTKTTETCCKCSQYDSSLNVKKEEKEIQYSSSSYCDCPQNKLEQPNSTFTHTHEDEDNPGIDSIYLSANEIEIVSLPDNKSI